MRTLNQLSPRLFWDVDRAELDPVRHAAFIIRRVAERGTLADVKLIWAYYDQSCIQEALTTARTLDQRVLTFFANQFGLPREAFRAYGASWN